MKKDELYKKFSHYEALSKDSSTHAQRVEIYRLMERSGINVPEDTDERLRKGKFPFNCDFFISKHPTAHIIKWVPTRSPEKKGKFTYKDPKYFLDILAGVSPTVAGVMVDPTNTILEDQAKHVGAVLFKAQAAKLTKEAVHEAIAEIIEAEPHLLGYAYDEESVSIRMAPLPVEPSHPYDSEVDKDLPF